MPVDIAACGSSGFRMRLAARDTQATAKILAPQSGEKSIANSNGMAPFLGGRATSSEKPPSFLDLNRVKNSQIGGCYLRYVGEVDGDADIQRSRPAFEDLGKAVGWSAGQGRDVCDLSSTTVGFWSSSSGNAIPTLTPNPVPSQSPPTRRHCCRNNPKKPPTSPA